MSQILDEYLAGASLHELARRYSVPYSTMRQRLVQFAPPARKRGQHTLATTRERFDSSFIPEPMSGCWLWVGAIYRKSGYGHFYMNGRNNVAHRAAWQIYVGEIPEKLEIDHICRVRSCVNPDHLRVVTKAENLAHRILIKDKCRNGHKFTSDNLYVEAKGVRRCKKCRIASRYKRKELA